VVDALTAILAQTKSKDVFAATVLALGQFGAEARGALPDILKNAERLGVLEGAFAQGGSKSAHGEVVLEAVAAIASGSSPQATPKCCYGSSGMLYSYPPPPGYGPVESERPREEHLGNADR
jgi:hypothetical protein